MNRERAEQELAEHVRKAISAEETAPKQKHVRLFAFDYKTSVPVWSCLKLQPLMSSEVPCFKALILIHKLLVDGPKIVLKEGQREYGFLDGLVRQFSYARSLYPSLIRLYVGYLKYKLEFHRIRPDFTGNFDYEEYVSLKGVSDLNEGYQTVFDLLELLSKIDEFQRGLIDEYKRSYGADCMVSSLVPFIEESYGVYKFVTSMLSALHLKVESHDALQILRVKYEDLFWKLKKFYEIARTIRYLTALVAIPTLPNEPQQFIVGQFDSSREDRERRERERQEQMQRERDEMERKEQEEMERRERERQEREFAELEMQKARQQQVVPVEEYYRVQNELSYFQNQREADQQLLAQYQMKMMEMGHQMNALTTQMASVSSNESLIKALQDQIVSLKGKFETMSKMYQNLRTEHLEVLNKMKEKTSVEGNQRIKELEAEKIELQKQMQHSIGELNNLRLETANSNDKEKLIESARRLADYQRGILNVLDSVIKGYEERIQSELFQVSSSMKTSSKFPTEVMVPLVEKAMQYLTEFDKTFQSKEGDLGILRVAGDLTFCFEQMLQVVRECKNYEEIVGGCKKISEELLGMYAKVRSVKVLGTGGIDANVIELQKQLANFMKIVEQQAPMGNEDLSLEMEMERTAKVIEMASERLSSLFANHTSDPSKKSLNEGLLQSAMGMTNAIGNLIKQATLSQQELVQKGGDTPQAFYKKNNRWTQGLISAAKAVAMATNSLVEIADAVLKGTKSMDALIVAIKEVSAATAQLMAASRVKAVHGSKQQERLESAARVVADCATTLVKTVQSLIERMQPAENFSEMTLQQAKVEEMNVKIKILELERELEQKRAGLSQLRKITYHDEAGPI